MLWHSIECLRNWWRQENNHSIMSWQIATFDFVHSHPEKILWHSHSALLPMVIWDISDKAFLLKLQDFFFSCEDFVLWLFIVNKLIGTTSDNCLSSLMTQVTTCTKYLIGSNALWEVHSIFSGHPSTYHYYGCMGYFFRRGSYGLKFSWPWSTSFF